MKKNNTQIIFGLHACLAALNNKIRKISNKFRVTTETKIKIKKLLGNK